MRKIVVLAIAVAISQMTYGQIDQIRTEIEKITENKKLKLGFALYDFSNGDTLSIHGADRFPMQSVFKLPLALAVLDEVDKKRLELNEPVLIEKSDLRPGLWSPIEKKYPQGDVRLTLAEIIKQTVAQSDNVGCDLLLKMLNGPTSVNEYIHSKGVTDICIKNNELEIQSSWNIQFDNWTTPQAMIQLLKRFDNKELLLPDTHTFLWDIMSQTSTGFIKNKLPKEVVVAHKTGHSGYNEDKVSAATNDVGIMVLPNGRKVAFALFITDSREPAETNANLITDIAMLLYHRAKEQERK